MKRRSMAAACAWSVLAASLLVRAGASGPTMAKRAPARDEITAVAPGQAVPGSTIRIYGRAFVPGKKLGLKVWTARGGSFRCQYVLTPGPERWVDAVLPRNIPAGRYLIAASTLAKADTIGTFDVVERVIVAPAMRSRGAAPLRLVPGQEVLGTWSGPGDTHLFEVAAGEGAVLRVLVERVDRSRSPLHPESADPEAFVADPDGLIAEGNGYANDRSADDTDAEIAEYVAEKSGLHVVGCRSLTAGGSYRLTVTWVALPPPGSFTLRGVSSAVVNAVASDDEPPIEYHCLVLDPRGLPAAGVRVTWDLKDLRLSPSGSPPSRADGIASLSALLTGDNGTAGFSFDWPWPARRDPSSVRHGRGSGAIIGRVERDILSGEITGVRLSARR